MTQITYEDFISLPNKNTLWTITIANILIQKLFHTKYIVCVLNLALSIIHDCGFYIIIVLCEWEFVCAYLYSL